MSRITLYRLLDDIESDNKDLNWFLNFAGNYLEFTRFGEPIKPNIQAEIISVNESNYHFFQYKDDGKNCITRPINTNLFVTFANFDSAKSDFLYALKNIKDISKEKVLRQTINKVVYTCQQSIGCTLDAINNNNSAKKKNGVLFEVLIKNIVAGCGIDVDDNSEVVLLPGGRETMKFEQDIILLDSEKNTKAIGQLKTSSKDRIDKIFLDKFMYNKLKKVDIPHFAIFLNDVQRKDSNIAKYGISSTFLPGHFKAYTIALNPLDGVYYIDLRPSISSDKLLKKHIKQFDTFLTEDMWKFIK